MTHIDHLEPRLLMDGLPPGQAPPPADTGVLDYFFYEIADGHGGTAWARVDLLAMPGDANLDLRVDGVDLNQLLLAWNKPGAWGSGDFDGNGIVDGVDLNKLLLNWSRETYEPSVRIADTSAAVDMVRLARPLLVYESAVEPGVWLASPLTPLNVTLTLVL